MATTQETVLKLKTTTARLKTKVAEHEGLIIEHAEKLEELAKKLETNDGENLEEFREELREQNGRYMRTLQASINEHVNKKLDDKLAALSAGDANMLQASVQPQAPVAKIKMLDTKPTKSWESGGVTALLCVVFLLLGLWIGAATSGDPVAYVGRSEDGARIVLAPVPGDADTANPDKMFTWKAGDTRIDPVTGKKLRLNVMNWEVVETPKPGRMMNWGTSVNKSIRSDTAN